MPPVPRAPFAYLVRMLTSELEYDLPADRIATQPVEPRDAARLMVVRREQERIEHRRVRDLADPAAGILRAGDLLVFNQSRVLPAHFEGTRAATGGRVTGLYLGGEPTRDDQREGRDDARNDTSQHAKTRDAHAARTWRVMLESGGKLRVGERIAFAGGGELELIERRDGGEWSARLHGEEDTLALLRRVGVAPLPPYIRAQRRRAAQPEVTAADLERYNTVYAAAAGSVAAPTAGLHFTPRLLDELRARSVATAFVTLHVGLGTFAPIRAERVEDHAIHREWIDVPAATIAQLDRTRAAGGRVIPVGTTTVRALESLPASLTDEHRRAGFATDTDLYITPGVDKRGGFRPYPFRFADCLMTNFHLPHSTLLALVAALPGVGIERLKRWYRTAIDEGYRFYSYGDAMWVGE